MRTCHVAPADARSGVGGSHKNSRRGRLYSTACGGGDHLRSLVSPRRGMPRDRVTGALPNPSSPQTVSQHMVTSATIRDWTQHTHYRISSKGDDTSCAPASPLGRRTGPAGKCDQATRSMTRRDRKEPHGRGAVVDACVSAFAMAFAESLPCLPARCMRINVRGGDAVITCSGCMSLLGKVIK